MIGKLLRVKSISHTNSCVKGIFFNFSRHIPKFDPSKDYYKALELSQEFDESDIKKSYYQLAKIYHPDSNLGSESQFKQINQAYSILSDPHLRSRYNKARSIQGFSPKMEDKAKGGHYSYQEYRNRFDSLSPEQQAEILEQTKRRLIKILFFGIAMVIIFLLLKRRNKVDKEKPTPEVGKMREKALNSINQNPPEKKYQLSEKNSKAQQETSYSYPLENGKYKSASQNLELKQQPNLAVSLISVHPQEPWLVRQVSLDNVHQKLKHQESIVMANIHQEPKNEQLSSTFSSTQSLESKQQIPASPSSANQEHKKLEQKQRNQIASLNTSSKSQQIQPSCGHQKFNHQQQSVTKNDRSLQTYPEHNTVSLNTTQESKQQMQQKQSQSAQNLTSLKIAKPFEEKDESLPLKKQSE